MAVDMSRHFSMPQLLKYAAPSIAMMIFTSIYGVVDGLFVSNFAGKTALATVNWALPIIMVLSSVGFMMGTGGAAIVSKTRGERDDARANRYFSLIVYATIAMGIVLAIAGAFILRPVYVIMGAEGEMLEMALVYGLIALCSLPFFMLQYLFQSFFVVAGKPQLGFFVVVAAGVANMVLDALFIGVFGWGVVGASLATSIGELIGGGVPLVYFARKNSSFLKLGRATMRVQDQTRAVVSDSEAAADDAEFADDVEAADDAGNSPATAAADGAGNSPATATADDAGNSSAIATADGAGSSSATATAISASASSLPAGPSSSNPASANPARSPWFLRVEWRVLGKTCANGSSEMVSNIAMSLVAMLYNFQLMRLIGEDGVAAYGVIMYVAWVFSAVFMGYAMGTSPLMSYQFGARNRVEMRSLFKKSLAFVGVGGMCMFVLAQACAHVLAQVFVGYDQGLFELTEQAFRIYAITYLLMGFCVYGSALFTALNNGLVSAAISFLRTLVFEVAAVLLLPVVMGSQGIWFAAPSAELVALIVTAAFVLGLGDVYGILPERPKKVRRRRSE